MVRPMRLNILVLHHLGDPLRWRVSMVEKELCLPLFALEHNYIAHNVALPLPAFVRDIQFDGIILTQTFLSRRRDPGYYRQALADYSFIKESSAFKIALPQDDYDCSAILDRWLVDWKVDLVYPVCADHWEVLYPQYSTFGRLKQGYTGYISDRLMERARNPKPISLRPIDVSYRAAKLLPSFGRLGYLKGTIGELFGRVATGQGLALDLSTDTIVGSKWFDFIEDSKTMLGVNSGSSLLDPEGLVNRKVQRYLLRHPGASFEEVEAACFPGMDGRYVFTAISPRNLECALLQTTQLLTPGPYSNMMRPWEHYVPLEPDVANFGEVLPVLKDHRRLETIAADCRKQILSFPELRYDNHVADLISEIQQGTKVSSVDRAASVPLFQRYREEMAVLEPAFWRRERLRKRTREFLASVGARRVKYFLVDLFGKS
jgi:hypothetical protein